MYGDKMTERYEKNCGYKNHGLQDTVLSLISLQYQMLAQCRKCDKKNVFSLCTEIK